MRAPLACAIAAVVFGFGRAASADEESAGPADQSAPAAAPPPVKHREGSGGPIVGLTFGRWMDVPITRVVVGVDAVVKRPSIPAAFAAHATIAAGRTESGLGAHRAEVGVGVSTPPWLLRLGVGVHLSYAMLQRTTVDTPFVKALFGNIGGFGIGAHAVLEGAVRVGETTRVTFGVRGSADGYDGGVGYEGGPFVGLRL